MSKIKSVVSLAALSAAAGLAMAQPANDLCANATVVGALPASIAGTTTNATDSAGVTTSCVNGTHYKDVWYRYTHTGASASITIALCGSASWDTTISAYTGSCGSLTSVACNDDSCSVQSSASFTASTGTTYYIRVGQYSAGTGGTFTLSVSASAPPPPATNGPDVIVGDIDGIYYWGSVGTTRSYSLGTVSCNIGDANLQWVSSTNQHPVIGGSLYRINNGRFEMIGTSWLKHGFTALTQNLCNTCSGVGGSVLGVGCSDPYSASLNGSQSNLGPRSHVNATTGHFPYPFTSPGAGYMVPPSAPATIGRRLQVEASDMFIPGATYISEAQYVTPDDASFPNPTGGLRDNALNNVSYRVSSYSPSQTVGSTVSPGGTTTRTKPAIMHWPVVDPTVIVTTHSYTDANNYVCRFYVGTKVTNNNNGTWTYTYAIYNLNSDNSASKFEIPCTNVTASNPYYRGVVYHSGENTAMNAAWVHTANASGISWATPFTFAQNSNTSALRWGTAATFSVTTNTAPTTGNATLTYFKVAGTLALNGIQIPSNGSVSCPADFNGDTTIDFFDYLDFVAAFSSNAPGADFNADTTIDFFDYLDFVAAFSSPC
ncbi:MAG: hypothetical protein KGS45_01130 [Planctomycetes bacterium]|nr:hypothetical protein [Planctomycetota bacterium]